MLPPCLSFVTGYKVFHEVWAVNELAEFYPSGFIAWKASPAMINSRIDRFPDPVPQIFHQLHGEAVDLMRVHILQLGSGTPNSA